MSNLKITLKSFAAIGAIAALGFAAQADEPKKKVAAEVQAEAKAAGGGAGKAAFIDLQVAKAPDDDVQGDVESEGDIAYNTVKADSDKLGPIKGESQDRAAAIKFDGVDGEAKDREPAAINAGCEPYPACARNKEAMEEEIAAPMKSDGFVPVAGAALAKDSRGEDRLTENVTLNAADGNSRKVDRVFLHATAPEAPGSESDIDSNTATGNRGGGKVDVRDINMKAASGGEDRLTENLTLNAAGPADAAGAGTDAKETIGGNDPISGIDIIVKKRPEDRN